MGENRRTTYRISEAARELGISAEWLRVGREGVSSLPLFATVTATATTPRKTLSACAKGEASALRGPSMGRRLSADGGYLRGAGPRVRLASPCGASALGAARIKRPV